MVNLVTSEDEIIVEWVKIPSFMALIDRNRVLMPCPKDDVLKEIN